MLNPGQIILDSYIWYSGTTSLLTWSCPAKIVIVNDKARTFQIMSLDDMKVQSQVYSFDIDDYSPQSRRSMKPTTNEKVVAYLRTNLQRSESSLNDLISNYVKSERELKTQIRNIEYELSILGPEDV